MLNPRRKYMRERKDDLCPFCGTEVNNFTVCKGCGAERIWSEKTDTGSLLFDTVYHSVFIALLLYFRQTIIYFLDKLLAGYGEIPYYTFLILCVIGYSFVIYSWLDVQHFTGPGWKRR